MSRHSLAAISSANSAAFFASSRRIGTTSEPWRSRISRAACFNNRYGTGHNRRTPDKGGPFRILRLCDRWALHRDDPTLSPYQGWIKPHERKAIIARQCDHPLDKVVCWSLGFAEPSCRTNVFKFRWIFSPAVCAQGCKAAGNRSVLNICMPFSQTVPSNKRSLPCTNIHICSRQLSL